MDQFDRLGKEQQAEILKLHAYWPPEQKDLIELCVDICLAEAGRKQKGTSREDYVKLNFIMKTNSFSVIENWQPNEQSCIQLSCINHSCDLNVNHHDMSWTDGLKVKIVRVRCHTAKGEEVIRDYTDAWAANRRAKGSRVWGFECACVVCDTNNPGMSSETRARHEKVFEQLRDNREELFESEKSTPKQMLKRHDPRLAAHKFLGPSTDMLDEYDHGLLLYAGAGDEEKRFQALKEIYKVATICFPPDHKVLSFLERPR